jgi:hypothetical protein
MSSVPIYQIGCPNGHTTELPETILEGIIQHLRGSYTGEPVLNFVCSDCKIAFHFDYQNRVRAGQTDAPRHLSEFHVLSVQSGCDGSNCTEHVVLVAVRNRDRSEESVLEERKAWNVSGITCKRGYQALPIGTPKPSWIQFSARSL